MIRSAEIRNVTIRMTLRSLKTFSVSLLVLLISSLAFGQGGSATGDLHVTVKDAKGGLVTAARVTVADIAKGVERTANSDGQGGYSAQQLPPGNYAVTVVSPGFATAEAKDVSITVGGLVELPVTLAVATGREVVEVSAQVELIETSRTSTTDTIGQRRIDNLPINGRNYINFTLTDSQVVRDNAPSLGAAPTSGLNMSGQRGRSNLVNVDGADATDNSVNGVRSTVSQEAVQEFQIITNNYSAEYGRAAGGVVNIITRSGSNEFHGDVFGYLRNRNFQAVNPFAVCPNPPCSKPAYTRVQAGAAFGGPIKKDKTYYYFSYEITRRHETGFSSIGQPNPGLCPSGTGSFGLCSFDTTLVGLPFGPLQLTPGVTGQIGFLTNPAVLAQEQADPFGFGQEVAQYAVLAGASSGQAIQGSWPSQLVMGATGGVLNSWAGFPTTSPPGSAYAPVPASYQTLASQMGNFPVFEGTSLYSLRLDHNISNSNRLTMRISVSPSTVTGIEVSGQDQPFGQNAYSRTSQQTYRDVAGVVQDTWTIGNSKVNEFRFQYARRGLSYFYNTKIPGGSDPAVNIPGFAYFGREPYSYIQRVETRYQFTDNFSWTIGRHSTKFGADFNYLPISAIFTVNYGGVYDFGPLSSSQLGFVCNPTTIPACPSSVPPFPGLSPVQAYGAGVPGDFIQGLGSPSDSFHNIPIGVFWQDSWRVRPTVTLNFGVRYDVEIAPKFKPPTALAQAGYNFLGLQKGIQTDKNNFQPRFGVAWDPRGDGRTVFRASYGLFYDHPLLGLYFLGDASDGSTSGQLAFPGGAPCNAGSSAFNPTNLNGASIFTGGLTNANCMAVSQLYYEPNQQQFQSLNQPQSLFLGQHYLTSPPAPYAPFPFPLAFQPFGYPQSKNFVYAYAQQANLSVERDLGGGFALSLAYNFNGGRHLNRPINASAVRGDLVTQNWLAAVLAGAVAPTANPFFVTTCGASPLAGAFPGALPFYVPTTLTNLFRPSGLNASMVTAFPSCIADAVADLTVAGLNAKCDPTTLANCVPFGDMDANYSNGSSVYHGFSANLRKRFSNHYEFLASYTWSHAIDDSTDLQATLTPQDSYYPSLDRSNSLFDQRHRFVFSGVYQTGKLGGSSFAGKLFSDWTFAPIIEVASGRPFNIITSGGDNLQLSSLTSRPNIVPAATLPNNCGYPAVPSKFSRTGFFQEPCFADLTVAQLASPNALLELDGSLGRNSGITPWTLFDDIRVAKRIYFGERYNMELIADVFNIANRYNVAAVSPLFSNAGQATAAYDPRQFQFALKFNW